MSIENAHRPMRGDEVEAWIKRKRDEFSATLAYWTLDDLLDDYRLHADTGTPLSGEVTAR